MLLTSLVFSQYPHEKYKGKDSVLYVDGEAIYNLADLRDEKYHDKIGHFTLEGKTYFVIVKELTGTSSVQFSNVYCDEDAVAYGTEDLKSVYEVSWSDNGYNAENGYHILGIYKVSPRAHFNGYWLFIFHTLPYEIAPDDPEVESVKGQLADGTIRFSLEPPATAA